MPAEAMFNVWTLVQIGCAALSVVLWMRWVVPAVRDAESPLTIDVWGPIALCAPAFWITAIIDRDIDPAGDAFIASPIALATAMIGIGILFSRKAVVDQVVTRFTFLAWLSIAIVLLLLAALNELSVWVGQTFFAASIVLLWCHTPTIPEAAAQRAGYSATGGLGVAGVLALGCCQGWAWVRGGDEFFSVGLMIFSAALAASLLATTLRAGASGLRLAGGVAILGPLLGLGILSLSRMLPAAWAIALSPDRDASGPPPLYLAFGIGAYALELALLVATVMVIGLAPLTGRVGGRVAGGFIAAAGLLLVTLRALDWL